jgi:hypothetical protein
MVKKSTRSSYEYISKTIVKYGLESDSGDNFRFVILGGVKRPLRYRKTKAWALVCMGFFDVSGEVGVPGLFFT